METMSPAARRGGTIPYLVRMQCISSGICIDRLTCCCYSRGKVILAVSTTAPNPLQALQDLASRAFDFPPWVDITSLRYFLIVHPSNSPLADPMYVVAHHYPSTRTHSDLRALLTLELKHYSMQLRSSTACIASYCPYSFPPLLIPTPFLFPLFHHECRQHPHLIPHLCHRRP